MAILESQILNVTGLIIPYQVQEQEASRRLRKPVGAVPQVELSTGDRTDRRGGGGVLGSFFLPTAETFIQIPESESFRIASLFRRRQPSETTEQQQKQQPGPSAKGRYGLLCYREWRKGHP